MYENVRAVMNPHLRVAVPHMRHVVDRVQVGPALLVVQVGALAPHNVQRLLVVEGGLRQVRTDV